MSKIQILKEEISNRIAAGEVIERPASVIKELVDNSIDAGATRIFINIEKAGTRLIQVSDNGTGMDRDDALLCLEAHATSKIRKVEDLDSITTFGFRGEAIPSIASVSRFELNTRQQDSIEGTRVICEGGTIKDVEASGCPAGTTISIRNLFYNVPARKKFLRSDATEEAHIHEIALLLALSRLDIHVELRFNGRLIFSVPAADDIRTRAALLFGRDSMKEMLAVNYAEAGIMVTGLVSRPGMSRNTRKEQRVFINGRPVAAPAIYNGIKEAYEGLIIKGRHAPCLLYYVINPSRVDINVHPAKREVRFKENHLIGKITAAAVSNALRGLAGSNIDVKPPTLPDPTIGEAVTVDSLPEDTEARTIAPPSIPPPMPVPDITRVTKPTFTLPTPVVAPVVDLEHKEESEASSTLETTEENSEAKASPLAKSKATAKTNSAFDDLEIIGQYKKRYILAHNKSGIVLISIGAAKERILFEKLQSQVANKKSESQFLLLPVTLELSPADARLVAKYLDKIQDTGFEIDHFGGSTYVVSAVPASFPNENINGIMLDLIDQLKENPRELKRMSENFIIQTLCRSALKKNYKVLAPEEIKHLINQLGQAQMPYSCPAGKPVLIHLSDNELLRRFGKKE
ncbi:MAG: DNA mismatch repair endonuclease MutL [Lentisphaerales bacterium]|nr:DNA mismatch repair endonuclease MutL [Lentisphaerales bacterium]